MRYNFGGNADTRPGWDEPVIEDVTGQMENGSPQDVSKASLPPPGSDAGQLIESLGNYNILHVTEGEGGKLNYKVGAIGWYLIAGLTAFLIVRQTGNPPKRRVKRRK